MSHLYVRRPSKAVEFITSDMGTLNKCRLTESARYIQLELGWLE